MIYSIEIKFTDGTLLELPYKDQAARDAMVRSVKRVWSTGSRGALDITDPDHRYVINTDHVIRIRTEDRA